MHATHTNHVNVYLSPLLQHNSSSMLYINTIYLLFLFSFTFMYRTKRSQTVVTEGIFELPNLTIQATRAQTLLLQAVYQSWFHSGNASSSTVNEALMNEVFQTTGKNTFLHKESLQ